jgi:predicted ribosome quality control (RQC) complex YloA/Tae2 family protein
VITPADVSRWTDEADPALRGAYVHRVWREGDAWVVFARHHEGKDPDAPAVRRVALEAFTGQDGPLCVALPPEQVAADDKRAKKEQGRDSHPFLSLLRKHLRGTRVESLTWVEGERIALLRCERTRPAEDPDHEGPPSLQLAIELFGRTGNLILSGRAPDSEVYACLGSLYAGRSHRPFDVGTTYRLPPAREPTEASRTPTLAVEVAPNAEALTLGQAVAQIQRGLVEEATQASRQGQLLKHARKGVKKLEGVIRKLESQLAEVDQADELERRGDLLKANLKQIKRGAAKVTLIDYSQGEGVEVEVELDPKVPAQDQMKKLYKRAKKLRNGEASVQMRLGETDVRLGEARELAELLEAADPEDVESLDAIEASLRKAGLLPKEKPQARRKGQINQGPRSYRSLEGHEILVGRSDDENDRLTMRMARGNDLFFHARGCPGSHVILRVDPKRPPNHETLLDAATLAAHYSKARNRGAVDVSYTPRKWVKKPKGAKPGLVQISNEKTIRAGHDQERLKRVLDSLRRDEEDA